MDRSSVPHCLTYFFTPSVPPRRRRSCPARPQPHLPPRSSRILPGLERIRNEGRHLAVLRAAMRMPRFHPGCGRSRRVGRFGIGHIDNIVASMKMPLGRLNCFHSARNLPPGRRSGSGRWRGRPQTAGLWNRMPARAAPRIARRSSLLPPRLQEFPVLVELQIRALVFPPCPSATNMSPFAAIATAFGWLNVSAPSPQLRPFRASSGPCPRG